MNHSRDLQQDDVFAQYHESMFRKIVDSLTPIIGQSEGEEIAQDALLKVFLIAKKESRLVKFASKLKAMRPLLFVMAKNMALSRIRHIKVREKFLDVQRLQLNNAGIKSIESCVIKDSQTQMLLEAVNHLPPICRQVFIQRKLYGKSHAQIATSLNISVKTVENHLANGLKLCRKHMLKKHITHSYKSFKCA
jgi:RNA polymerase sigma-70 factor (ECF subfamily)